MTQTLHAPPRPPQTDGLRVTIEPAFTPPREVCIGQIDTIYGPVVLAANNATVLALGLTGELGPAQIHNQIHRQLGQVKFVEAIEALTPIIDSLTRNRGEIRVSIAATPFQRRVWHALLDIKRGDLSTYGRIAQQIGQPRAARAVATAIGQNPVGWIVPCHRVVRSDATLGGYRWGTGIKRKLLANEGCTAKIRGI